MSDSPADEGRLFQAVQAYLREVERGQRPDRREWLARYPDLAPALDECLAGLELMHTGAAALGAARQPGPESGGGIQPGSPIGDFQIVREIGRGGMGIIYEAIQLSLGRRVALKVLPFAAGFDAKYLQRFRQESQAAAQLHHNNIVPVYGVGCERGVHFYAMQLIDGLSLDRVIEQLRCEAGAGPLAASVAETSAWGAPSVPPASGRTAAAGPTLTGLSADLSTQRSKGRSDVYREVVRLMAQAAEALEYAHQRGIIHRDIKPANLLVDTQRNLWITDFGLAHLHAEQSLTRSGDLLGTLRYASPEQVSGQRVLLDHRTDLYSLGATFYELVTLRPVFSAASRQALLHQALNQEPVRPRSIERSVPPELETILLKLLGKNPAERYNSAQELADDLRRFLRDEPIAARPPSLAERLRKWGRRHPAYVRAAVLVMFVTLVISGVSNWRVSRANRRAQTAFEAERLRAEEAEQRFSQARQAVDFLIEISENDLADKPPLQPLQRKLLETALVFYQNFIGQRHNDPSREAELIAVQRRLRKVLDDLSVMEGAFQLVLLAEKSVQADLGLNQALCARIDASAREFSEQHLALLRGYQQLASTARRERFLEFARANERVTRSMLNEQQLKRLQQIRIQLQGFMAFNEPELVAALKLTDLQRQGIRQVEVETFVMMREAWGMTDENARRELRDNLFQAALDKSLALLTPGQLGLWKDLTGPKFQGRLVSAPPGMLPRP